MLTGEFPQTRPRIIRGRSSISSEPADKIPAAEGSTPVSPSDGSTNNKVNGINRGANGGHKKGRFSSIVSNINPLPALGFRRRKDSLSKEDLPSTIPKMKDSQSSGFTAVATPSEDDFEFSVNFPTASHRRDSSNLRLLDPDAISEKSQRLLRNSVNQISRRQSADSIAAASRSVPAVPTYQSIDWSESKTSEIGARGSRENTPERKTPKPTKRMRSDPRFMRDGAEARDRHAKGNLGQHERREKERNRPTLVNISLSIEDLNLAVVVFLMALTLADITGKMWSSIGTALFVALGLNQWKQVHQLRMRRQERLKMRRRSRQISRRTRRRMMKDAVVLDIT